jgi:hypothetical protein
VLLPIYDVEQSEKLTIRGNIKGRIYILNGPNGMCPPHVGLSKPKPHPTTFTTRDMYRQLKVFLALYLLVRVKPLWPPRNCLWGMPAKPSFMSPKTAGVLLLAGDPIKTE